jgi:hypothetical protein
MSLGQTLGRPSALARAGLLRALQRLGADSPFSIGHVQDGRPREESAVVLCTKSMDGVTGYVSKREGVPRRRGGGRSGLGLGRVRKESSLGVREANNTGNQSIVQSSYLQANEPLVPTPICLYSMRSPSDSASGPSATLVSSRALTYTHACISGRYVLSGTCHTYPVLESLELVSCFDHNSGK